jgi:hypothetical protein
MKAKRWIMIASLVLVLVVNGLANILPINGLTTGEVSDDFPILFVPAGYVFSIWGLIYLALIAFAIYIVTPRGRENEKIDSIAWWFVAANIFNSTWVFLWHYLQFPLTLIAIVGLLVSLIAIFLKLGIGVEPRPLLERLVVAATFSIYLGWATVAVVANFAQTLYSIGYRGDPLSQVIWTLLLLLVATGLGIVMIFKRRQVAYPLVLTWAFVGIYVKQADTPLVAYSALVLGIAIAVLAFARPILTRRAVVN